MYQIISLRPNPHNTGSMIDSQHFKKNWRFTSIEHLFQNIEKYIAVIPENERYDLFFTVNDCLAEKRKFLAREYHAIDIDGGPDLTNPWAYAKIIAETLKIKSEKIGISCSGNGLHFYIKLKEKITDKDFYKKNKVFNDAVNDLINKNLGKAGLTGLCDNAVFDAGRIMRLPQTENRKKGKTPTKTYIINSEFEAFDLNLVELSGIPPFEENDTVDGTKFDIDSAAVMSKCAFLKEMIENPSWVHENHLYAAFSFVSRFDDSEAVGRTMVHNIQKHGQSETINSYQDADISKKLNQAEKASGPRTCENINTLWHRCRECPYKDKINSPISLKSDNYIRTKKTGFWNMAWKESLGKYVPVSINYEDLAKYFVQLNGPFVSQAKSVWSFNGKFYREWNDEMLESFALQHVNPMPLDYQRREFRSFLEKKNVLEYISKIGVPFWNTSKRKVNFRNGYLNLDTMTLSPHTHEVGFKYCLDYDYEPRAVAPSFEKFLSDVTQNDSESILLLKEFIGYCISGDSCWANKSLILTGDGSNGKSTFLKLLKNIMGGYAHTAYNLKSLKDSNRRAGLDGALFNVCEEASKYMGDGSDIKAMISGDEIEAKRLYKDSYTFVNRAKLLFSCNQLPENDDYSHGFYRRFFIIPFNQTFDDSNRDIHIVDKLDNELAGIFNSVMEAYKGAVGRKHFSHVKSSEVMLQQYKSDSDIITDWVTSQIVFNKDTKFYDTTQLFERFKLYYEASQIGYHHEHITVRSFGRRLKIANKQFDSRFVKNRTSNGYTGISFINDHNTDF